MSRSVDLLLLLLASLSFAAVVLGQCTTGDECDGIAKTKTCNGTVICCPKGEVGELMCGTNGTAPVCSCTAVPEPTFTSDPAPGEEIVIPQTFVTYMSDPAVLTVNNTGNAPLTLKGFNVTNAFSVDASGTVDVDSGSDLSIKVFCQPDNVGETTGKLTFTTNDPDAASVSYTLSCNAVDYPVVWSVPPPYSLISFGNNNPKDSPKQTAKVQNNGEGKLTIHGHTFTNENFDGKTVSDQFSVDGLPDSLDPNEEVKITLQCHLPSDDGLLYSTLVIETDDPANPQLVFDLACWAEMQVWNVLLGFTYLLVFWAVTMGVVGAVLYFRPQ